jgi:hypothetical protein
LSSMVTRYSQSGERDIWWERTLKVQFSTFKFGCLGYNTWMSRIQPLLRLKIRHSVKLRPSE